MSKPAFTFPPPPPPPPRREAVPATNTGPSYGHGTYHQSGRGSSFGRRGDRGAAFSSAFTGTRSGNGYYQDQQGRGTNGYAPRGRGQGPVLHNSPGSAGGGNRYDGALYHPNRGNPTSAFYVGNAHSDQIHTKYGQRNTEGDSSTGLNASQKREYATAFKGPRRGGSRPQAAPAVPSFLSTIPGLSPHFSKATTPVAEEKTKRRKNNQLGLTPAVQEQESSSNDEDEEARLSASTSQSGLQFEYHGQISRLKSAAEIAAWIAERRKRYPTQAKAEKAKREAEEKNQKWEEEKKSNQKAARQRREDRDENEKENRKLRQELEEARQSKDVEERLKNDQRSTHLPDAAETARLKTEKLLKKAAKAQKALAKAEGALRRAQNKAGQYINIPMVPEREKVGVSGADTRLSVTTTVDDEDDPVGAISGVRSTESTAKDATMDLSEQRTVDMDRVETSLSLSLLEAGSVSSELSDTDVTSSSGSSSSDSDSDSDPGSHSAPEIQTIRRIAPERILPPPRTGVRESKPQNLCQTFLKTGRCKFGNKCRYLHEVLGRSSHGPKGAKSKRKSLWQLMMEKEQEEERKQVLGVIISLGESGLLAENDQYPGPTIAIQQVSQ